MVNNSLYNTLLSKIDQFTRKYYLSKILKGALLIIGIGVGLFLLIALLEYFFWFPKGIRKTLWFGFLAITMLVFVAFIAIPVFRLFKLGKQISYEQASFIIGNHFTEVKDKLLNVLQLGSLAKQSDNSLLLASVDQKIEELKYVPFQNAINFSENKPYLKYALIPLLIFIALLLMSPNVIKDSSERLIKNDIEFSVPVPFKFNVTSKNAVKRFDDITIELELLGEEIPNEVAILIDGYTKDMKSLGNGLFSYELTNVAEPKDFQFRGNGFYSDQYHLDVINTPVIKGAKVSLNFPSYLGIKNKIVENISDLQVPEGTGMEWIINLQSTDYVGFKFGNEDVIDAKKLDNNKFALSKTLKNSGLCTVYIRNNETNLSDSIVNNIQVIKDKFPFIYVQEVVDSNNKDVRYFFGEVSDDYGISNLSFIYEIESEEIGEGRKKRDVIAIPLSSKLSTEFTYTLNIPQTGLQPGEKLSYYFKVTDNDGVNGPKSSKSKWMVIAKPKKEELQEENNERFDELKNNLSKNINETKQLKEEAKNLQNKLLQKENIGWEEKKQIEDLIEKQKALEKNIENIQQNYNEFLNNQEEYKQVNPELAKKQEQVQKLMENVMNEEMKELMERLENLLDEMDKEKALEEMQDMELNDEELENELDRMLELLEKLEFEQKMNETIEKLKELAEKQEALSEETKKNGNSEELEKKQEDIKEEFEEVKKSLEEMSEKLPKEAKEELEEMTDAIEKEMDDSKESLTDGDKKESSKQQKSAADKMNQMANKMSDMLMQMQAQQTGEDLETIRQLLENLVTLSFDQETVMDNVKNTSINTPKYVSLVQDQYKIKDDTEIVKDSLYALAKRQFQIEAFVTEKIEDISRNIEKSLTAMEERKISNALTKEQLVMTGFNDLALMLSETMEQMQQQMAQQMEGNQMCENPGSNPKPGKGKLPSLKQMQQQLNDQINQLGQQMKEGEGSKPGMSKKVAEMAAKQQAIRQALQKLQQEEGSNGEEKPGGKSGSQLQEIIEQMEKTETDLVNKQLTNEMLKRQQDIMVKLLEAEKAEKERGEKQERKSNTAQDVPRETPPEIQEFLQQKKESIDLYKSLPPGLKPYYKSISEKYFKNVSGNN